VGQLPSCDRELGEQSVADWTLRQLVFPVAFYADSGAVGVQAATTLRPTDSKEISCFLLTCGYPLERAKGIEPS
jgi:hypothetical protein